MADEAAAPAANDTPTPVAAPTGNVSADDAVAFLRERRNGPQPATPREEAGAAETESPSQDDDAAAAHEQPLGETDETDPAGEPPISPPKSWTRAEKEAFASLPREHQQSIVDRETERESYYRKGHDEAANEKRAATAERQAAEQARQQYEQHLPALRDQWQVHAQRMQEQFANKWTQLRSPADVAQLRETDPIKWMEFRDDRDAVQQAHVNAQQADQNARAADHNRRIEEAKQWQAYIADEDAKFFAKAPEFKDAKRAAAAGAEARSLFADLGFKPEEVTGAWDHGQGLSLRDHRVQLLVRDALRYRAAEKARKAATPKPVPPVQRPGVATSKGEVSTAHIQQLTSKVKSTGRVDDAVALLRATRNARAKAS